MIMSKQVEPISPQDLKNAPADRIESEMRQAVNELLTAKYKDGRATIKKNELIDRYMSIKGITDAKDIKNERNRIFDNLLLDIEPLYRSVGWNVTWESPDRGENFDEYFKFEVKK